MWILFHTQGVACNWVKNLTVSVQILCTFNTTVSTLEGYKFIITSVYRVGKLWSLESS